MHYGKRSQLAVTTFEVISGSVEQRRKQQLRPSFRTPLFFQNEVLRIPLENVGQSPLLLCYIILCTKIVFLNVRGLEILNV